GGAAARRSSARAPPWAEAVAVAARPPSAPRAPRCRAGQDRGRPRLSRATRARAAPGPPATRRAGSTQTVQQPRAAAGTPGWPRGSPARPSSYPTPERSTWVCSRNTAPRRFGPLHVNEDYVKSEFGQCERASSLGGEVERAGQACGKTVRGERREPIRLEETHQEPNGQIRGQSGADGGDERGTAHAVPLRAEELRELQCCGRTDDRCGEEERESRR